MTAEIDGEIIQRAGSHYGFELILDLHHCNPETFTRQHIDSYFTELCNLIQMQRCEVHFWDDLGLPPEEHQTLPHTKGTSAVCFILTSSIVIHTLDILKTVYVNVFSCRSFDAGAAEEFTKDWFEADSGISKFIHRQ